ncbi:tachykinin-3b [Salminus brasiliensis]|uniref:tachykinin-3b n=1 Tax=Salminus brasiliensis TaxID=930266 RepID=UPI003B838ADA
MAAGWCLVLPWLLLLALTRPGSSSSALGYFTLQDNAGSLSGRVERQYDEADYDSFIGLMGRRNADINEVPPFRRDMDDIFVGLLGRRSSDSGTPPWRGQRRGGFFMKNGKFRFQRAV